MTVYNAHLLKLERLNEKLMQKQDEKKTSKSVRPQKHQDHSCHKVIHKHPLKLDSEARTSTMMRIVKIENLKSQKIKWGLPVRFIIL